MIQTDQRRISFTTQLVWVMCNSTQSHRHLLVNRSVDRHLTR